MNATREEPGIDEATPGTLLSDTEAVVVGRLLLTSSDETIEALLEPKIVLETAALDPSPVEVDIESAALVSSKPPSTVVAGTAITGVGVLTTS